VRPIATRPSHPLHLVGAPPTMLLRYWVAALVTLSFLHLASSMHHRLTDGSWACFAQPSPPEAWPDDLLSLSMDLHLILVVVVAHRLSLCHFWSYLLPPSRLYLHMSFIAITKDSHCKFHQFGSHLACRSQICRLDFRGLVRKLCLAYTNGNNGCAILCNLPCWRCFSVSKSFGLPGEDLACSSWVGGRWQCCRRFSFLRAWS
jgi:hypothetical protein